MASTGQRYCLIWWFLSMLYSRAQAAYTYDPIGNFCRITGHSSTIKNGILYINGGIETFSEGTSSNLISGINEGTFTMNMTASRDWTTNPAVSWFNKSLTNSSVSDEASYGLSRPISTQLGALFAGRNDSTLLYSYGGTTSGFNISFPAYERPTSMNYGLWDYNVANDTWTPMDTSLTCSNIPSYGSSAESPLLNLAFYVGGQVDNGSADTVSQLGNSVLSLNGMVVLNPGTQQLLNISVPPVAHGERTGASAIYIAGYGTSGVLLLLGGMAGSGGDLLPMDNVAVFDVSTINANNLGASVNASQAWYIQRTSGTAPNPRKDFCLVSAVSQDSTSTNVYLYAGRNESTSFCDVYVLSLPSFTWVEVWFGEDDRWGHTCNLVSQRQMVTVGGGGESAEIGLDCDERPYGLSFFDLTTLEWSSTNEAGSATYLVPDAVVQAIGGTSKGGATKNVPDSGFSSPELAQLFTPSGSGHHSNSLSRGAIAGIAVGATVAVLVAAAAAIMTFRRKRTSNTGVRRPPRQVSEADGHVLRVGQYERAELSPEGKQKSATLQSEAIERHEMEADTGRPVIEERAELEGEGAVQ